MKAITFLWITAIVTFLLQGFGAIAEPANGEYLSFYIPDSKSYFQAWRNYDSKSDHLVVEYLPKGQTTGNWREMVSVSVNYRNISGSVKTFAQRFLDAGLNQCGGNRGQILKTGKANGYRYALLFYSCPKTPETGKPEWGLIIAVKGRYSFYTGLKLWRQKPDNAAISEWRKIIGQAYVCDTRRPNRPCKGEIDGVLSK